MKQTRLYALDFDGVICDSAIETGVAGWKAGLQIWDDYSSQLPPSKIIEQFRQIRPVLETGYEAILIIRLLFEGNTVHNILDDYSKLLKKTIAESNLNIDALKKLFGTTRDQWISNDLDDWVAMNPLFSGVSEKLQELSKQEMWYIITTKQERFVKHILAASHIELPDSRIFGLDKNMNKEAVLLDLMKRHADLEIHFVEDRLPTIFNVIDSESLTSVKLLFALWGYNTDDDKDIAGKQTTVESIMLDNFLV
jgi:phosphoglycolate phosphatase-like HAD superfamily hydrolase